MPDHVGMSVVVKRMIQLEYVRPLVGSYPGDIVFSYRTVTCLCSERSLQRRPCLLSLESLPVRKQSSPNFRPRPCDYSDPQQRLRSKSRYDN
jgi:hypothetical protein